MLKHALNKWLIPRFLRKSQLAMSEDLKQQVKQDLRDGANIEKTIFDHMEQEVSANFLIYRYFLKSTKGQSYVP